MVVFPVSYNVLLKLAQHDNTYWKTTIFIFGFGSHHAKACNSISGSVFPNLVES